MAQAADIAFAFVEVVLKYSNWPNVAELHDNEVQTLFDTVVAAGFEPTKVTLGKLPGFYLDQDGSRTGETYPINDFCPYKVLGQNGEDHFPATAWLNRVLGLAIRSNSTREELIKEIQAEIWRSVPLESIQLTAEGDLLTEYPSASGNHTRDHNKFSTCVGVHDYCRGWMDRHRATKSHDAIVCRKCYLRVLFPSEIITYGEFREAMLSKNTSALA